MWKNNKVVLAGLFLNPMLHCQCGSYFQKRWLLICRAVNWCQSSVTLLGLALKQWSKISKQVQTPGICPEFTRSLKQIFLDKKNYTFSGISYKEQVWQVCGQHAGVGELGWGQGRKWGQGTGWKGSPRAPAETAPHCIFSDREAVNHFRASFL